MVLPLLMTHGEYVRKLLPLDFLSGVMTILS